MEITQCADFFPVPLTEPAKSCIIHLVRRAPYTEGMLPYQYDSVCGPAVSGENRQHKAAGAYDVRDTGEYLYEGREGVLLGDKRLSDKRPNESSLLLMGQAAFS